MQRLLVPALMLSFVFATAAVAQAAADMGHPSASTSYGPQLAVPEAVKLPPERRPYAPPDLARPAAAPEPDLVASRDLTSQTTFGVGAFHTTEPVRPFAVPRDESRDKRIAGAGVALKF